MVALACRVRTGHFLTTRARSAGNAPDFAPPFAEPDVVVEDSELGCEPLGSKTAGAVERCASQSGKKYRR